MFSAKLPAVLFDKEVAVNKKCIVELTAGERSTLEQVVRKLKGTS